MSKFFEALEQAGRDRALREQTARQEPVAERTQMPAADASTIAAASGPAEQEQTAPVGPARRDTRAGSLPIMASTAASGHRTIPVYGAQPDPA